MYVRARTLDEAVRALETPDVQILAGGTDFYPAHVGRTVTVPVLDITGIGEIAAITTTSDHVRIGAGVTWSQFIATPLPACFDALKAAAREVGSIQIQNRATIAGNLCNASPAADGVPPLLTLDAEVELLSRAGARRLPLAEFITGNRKTELKAHEILSAIIVPRTIDGTSAFVKLGARRYLVISIAMVAAVIERDGNGAVAQARIAVGSCSAVARRLRELEQRLQGAPCKPGLGDLVEAGHQAALSPIDDVRATAAYRRDAARTLVARAIEQCVGG